MSDSNKEYWENPKTVSLLDKNLRTLETNFVLSHISSSDELADFGCGDGESTVHYATKVKTCLALERSNTLRSRAAERFKEKGLTNVTLVGGDANDLSEYVSKFNVAVTQRVLINFLTWGEQQQVIKNIWHALRPGGRYLMLENTFEGHEALDAARRSVGLPNIKLHDWHSLYLHYGKLMEFLDGKFVVEKTQTFNLYYLLTRVFMNKLATFEGYGTNATKDPIFDRADAAARELYEVMGSQVHIDVPTGSSFGPIQGWVLRRMG